MHFILCDSYAHESYAAVDLMQWFKILKVSKSGHAVHLRKQNKKFAKIRMLLGGSSFFYQTSATTHIDTGWTLLGGGSSQFLHEWKLHISY